MPSAQAREAQTKQRRKPSYVVACAVATGGLVAAVAATCVLLQSRETNNADSPSSISNQDAPQPSNSSSAPGLRSQVPSKHPISVKETWKDKMNAPVKVPSTHPTSLKKVADSNDFMGDIEISNFKGPITEFLVTEYCARIQNHGCKSNEGRWRFVLDTDAYPWETSWALTKGSGQTIASGPPEGSNYARYTRYIGSMCLEAGSYALTMKDRAGDGICCDYGKGSFSITIDDDNVVKSNDADFNIKSYPFNINQPAFTEEEPCFPVDTYNSIDNDIAKIKNGISDSKARSHFLGGIVRLAAHDFMDYNPHRSSPMGPDGCFEADHPANNGLDTIWCSTCSLTLLYVEKYSRLVSRADFWIAAANAVIRQTSVGHSLDLKQTFLWGRKDADSCQGSGSRLPTTAGCDQSEKVFLTRMGVEWRDVVALMVIPSTFCHVILFKIQSQVPIINYNVCHRVPTLWAEENSLGTKELGWKQMRTLR